MRARWLGLVVLYLVLLLGGWYAGRWLDELVAFDVRPQNEAMVHTMIMTSMSAYVAASAVPFVPGAEIGFGLIFVFGARIAVLVYVGMVAALLLSYLVGRFVPVTVVAAAFEYFGMTRAGDLARRLAPLDAKGRLDHLMSNAPRRAVPFLLKHRYLALIALFNLPGNSIIGGGGGIAFAAGLSRLFPFPAYLASVLIAVAPVPLFFVLSDYFA